MSGLGAVPCVRCGEAREHLRDLQGRLDPSDGRQAMTRDRLAAVETRLSGGGGSHRP